jgi:peptidoglycan/LPS O-acetylase OafA/YrhL
MNAAKVATIADISRAHYVQLDGLRGLAILLVIVYHFALPHVGFHSEHASPLLRLAEGGWMGVDLFFVLSGFLITGILVETKTNTHYFRNFLARRFLRIWPLYYLSLFALIVVLPHILSGAAPELRSMQAKQAWFWLYGANWLFASESGFGQTSAGYFWSLAVEEQFYLIWPFVVYQLSERALLRTSLVLLCMSLVLRLVLANFGVNTNALYTMTFTHLDGLAVGSAIAVAMRSPALEARVQRFMPAAALAALLGLVAVRIADRDLLFWSRYMATYGYTLIVLLFGSLLVYVLRGESVFHTHKLLSSAFMTRAGKYSYALYMVHVPVASLVFPATMRALAGVQEAIGYEAVYLVCVAVSFAASWALAVASWHLVEKRILSLKRFFTYG